MSHDYTWTRIRIALTDIVNVSVHLEQVRRKPVPGTEFCQGTDNPCHIVGLDCVATGLEVNLIACVHVVSGRCRDPATDRHCNVNDERGLIFRKPREPDFGGEGSNTPR